jgi:hypothetical protein
MQVIKKILSLTEIKYIDFVRGHLASAETESPKRIEVTKWIHVALKPGGTNMLPGPHQINLSVRQSVHPSVHLEYQNT